MILPAKRLPIPKFIVLIRSDQQKNLLARKIANLPVDSDNPIQVVISEQIKKRGLDQNSYYWLRLGEISAQAFSNGRQYSADVWHEYCKRHKMPDMIEIKTGDIVSKWIELPDGDVTVRSTTELSKRCFADYTTICEAFGSELGVMFSADPRGGNEKIE